MDFLDATLDILQDFVFDADKAWYNAVDEMVQDLIVHLITKEQLGNQGEGIDGHGNSLGEYSAYTVSLRKELGLQVDHVSFEQTGDYLRSVDVIVTRDGWYYKKDEDRFYELTVLLGFSEDHIMITKENEQKVFELIRENYERYTD